MLSLLVVEDDFPTLELLGEVLTSLGVEVRLLSNSEEAASLIGREKFDGVFLDLVMPKIDGFELARRIRQSPSNSRTPIVVVSGRGDRHTMEQAFTAGANFFLAKPVGRQTLTHLLNSSRGAMLEERRRYKRIPLLTPMICRVDSRVLHGMSANLSQSGMLFETDGSLNPRDRIRFEFQLPVQPGTIQAEALVIRIDGKKRAGVRFLDLGAGDRDRIRDWIAAQDEAESKPPP